ncbi:2-oxoglutarate and iron-dependent oxygenase domain-containing protein 3-like isoform X2 [Mercenaria mercenaria]|uniref:2-oxoglutarate and iron-dependent oxygenase domain-containing protein 3-like isoform X2 n=1 Tax=Mercenaria mercenaria TaxID=6596 RepID=UPI00234FAF0C|nr:2-oxoglutarate and iron-dependent oxygenase domain-containing protein 3-like isoform X2 [Mercenaria mercenaria]
MALQARERKPRVGLYSQKDTPKRYIRVNDRKNQRRQIYAKYVVALVSLIGLCLGLYWKSLYSTSSKMSTFAPANQQNSQLTYTVNCSEDYKNEMFEECKPKSCARVVMDNLVSGDEALHMLSVAKKGLSYGGSTGGASILDLHSGALSMGEKFVNIYRVLPEEDGFKEEDFAIYRQVKNKIHQAISEYFGIPKSSIYLTKPTFFSRMNTTAAKTVHDEYWHKHVDKTTYGSFHYTSLLYLTTYGTDFTGGRFIFVDGETETAVEPRSSVFFHVGIGKCTLCRKA